MKVPPLTMIQSNILFAIAAAIFATAALQTRLMNAVVCTWTSVFGSILFAIVALKGYRSRLVAITYTGAVVLASSWGAYGIWHLLTTFRPASSGGIDPFAGPLSIIGLSTCLAGLGIYVAGASMFRNSEKSFMRRFTQQRGMWILGAALLFSFTYFAHHLNGV